MPGTFSVPERRPFSCPPPSIWQRELDPRLLAPDEQRARALRAVVLVPGEREQVDAHRVDVDRDLARRLRRVGVEQRAALARRCAPISASGCSTPISLFAAITETSTVLSVIAARSSSRSTKPSRVDAEQRDAPALALEPLARVEHGLVLGRDGDDVIAAVAAARARAPLIARLFDSVAPLVKTISPADGADERRDLRARAHRPLRRACQPYACCWLRRVAELLGEVRQHRLEHARIDRRRGVVVEIDGLRHSIDVGAGRRC